MPDDRGLHASSIEVSVRGEQLVRGVNLSIPPGTTTAVVGESGSGKSLTARALVGLLPDGVDAAGELELAGRTVRIDSHGPEISNRWRELRGSAITLLLQDPFTSLSPVHSIGRQVRDALRRAGHRVTRGLLEQRIGEVGLHVRVLKQYPHELSGGMRQRVAIVLALAADPAVLIADEPTTALDSLTQFEILTLLDELKRSRRMSVLLISHDLDVVAGHADTVLVMCAGSVVERGPAAAVLTHPVHPYTRGLLAAAPRPGHQPKATGAPWLPTDRAELPPGTEWGSYAAAAEMRLGLVPVLIPVVADMTAVEETTDTAGAPQGDQHVVGVLGTRPDEVVRVHAVASPADTELSDGQPVDDENVNTGESTGPARTETLEHGSEDVVLHVEGLRLSRSAREVLGGVSFEVREGEIMGMVGESGSGKTTVARCVAGLERHDSGNISVREARDDSKAGPRSRGVQMVFQDPAGTLNPALNVRTTLTEALRAAGNSEDTPEDLMQAVGLDAALLMQRPRKLSGGQRQRVAIARALAGQPRLLVCDEAVSALDVSVQAQILALLHRLRDERDLTLLFITHDLAVVGQLCDRVIVLNNGLIVEMGEVNEVLSDPQDAYTRSLLAASHGVN